jgi:2-succinyl-6-hydroxy-2,4-cyclohexadiene-1-carboxylate synthase
MTRMAVRDVHFNIEMRQAGPALLLLHGFTGSSAAWEPYVEAWSEFTTIAVDLLGHGRSDCPADPDRYRMECCVADLLAVLDTLGVERTAVLGYSLGGRVALHLALHAPERLWALILVSASPGIEDAGEREERRASDAALAAVIERDGIVAFVDRWQALPLFATQARLPAPVRAELRRQRLNNTPRGLANSLRGLGAGMQEPALYRLGQLRVPTLLLAGALDAKYCQLARRMEAALPEARCLITLESGHAIHLEQPAFFMHSVRAFLNRCRQNQSGKKENLSCA